MEIIIQSYQETWGVTSGLRRGKLLGQSYFEFQYRTLHMNLVEYIH